MDENWNDPDTTEPDGDPSPDQETDATFTDDEMASRIARFATSGPPVDPERVWVQIAAGLDELPPPRRPLLVRGVARAGRALRRVARFATITGGGWGGPLFVGLFAILVIATLIAARVSQGHGLS